MSTKAARPKAPNFNEHAMDSIFQSLRQRREQLIIKDNFLNSDNLDRLMQLQDINSQQQQDTSYNNSYITHRHLITSLYNHLQLSHQFYNHCIIHKLHIFKSNIFK
jgi:meiotically up-regulated gene 157 (Mug157) protein